jgi:cell wall-associated NlpC family hydrolase
MNHGICLLSIIPCRKEPSGMSEMVTQLLFGDAYTVVESQEDWLKIETTFDHYPCWISAKQHQPLSEKEFNQLDSSIISSELVQVITNLDSKAVFPITIGATLPNFKNNQCIIGSHTFLFEGVTASNSLKKMVEDLKQTAFLFLNAPYMWGGKSPFGIDCSGFTQLIFKLNGYQLPRDAFQQVELGMPLSFVEEAQTGDLAFFDNEEGSIVHVGMVIDNQQIIHASGSVRIDKFDHYGIFNSDTKKYSHMLRVIKHLLN